MGVARSHATGLRLGGAVVDMVDGHWIVESSRFRDQADGRWS
jgi:hypothetical protein